MGDIINITNFNKYCGRYSSKKGNSPEDEIGWSVDGSLIEKFPILALRNRNHDDDNWPLTWKNNRNLPIAIDLVLSSLKAWQAFRPESAAQVSKRLSKHMPRILLRFQDKMKNMDIYKASDINKLSDKQYKKLIKIISETVCKISTFKSSKTPMLGSKVMHHFFPELFPVWDTAWIKNKALKKELFNLDCISSDFENPVEREYGNYFEIMLNDLRNTSRKEINNIKKTYIRHSGIPKNIIDWHFYDLSPIIFEFCLLGRRV